MASSLPAELQGVAEALANQIGRPVAIEDDRLRLLVHTPHEGPVDDTRLHSILRLEAPAPFVSWAHSMGIAKARGVMRLPANPNLQTDARVVAAIRSQDILLGYIWLVDDGRVMDDVELRAVEDAAALAGAVIHRHQLLGDVRRGRQRELLRDLLTHEEALRRAAVDELVAGEHFVRDSAVVVLVVQLARGAAGEESAAAVEGALERASRRLAPRSSLFLARADQGVLLVSASGVSARAPRMRETAKALHEDLAQQLAPQRVLMGVGAAVRTLADALRSYDQARRAIQVAEVVSGFGSVATWEDLGVYRVLVQLPLDDLPADVIHPALLELFENDGPAQLVRTLETYLDLAGDVGAASDALGIHRTSLYYRLGRIEKITRLRLGDGGERLALHLGLKLARLAGLHPDQTRGDLDALTWPFGQVRR